MSKDVGDLRSDVKVAAVEALADIKAAGIDILVTSTSRSIHHQIALWAQGRCPLVVVNHLRMLASMLPIKEAENKYTVTNCDGVTTKSAHQDDRAIDVVVVRYGKSLWNYKLYPQEYKQIGDIFRLHGFTWGGDFKPIDPVSGLGFDPFHAEMA